jgi:Zn-finger nucleic acid-binding protein
MKCPTCTETDLVMTDRQGVEIDYCPKCRGVWLDRGELDKIIERSSQTAPLSRRDDDDWDDDDKYKYGKKKSKTKRIFGEIFDF